MTVRRNLFQEQATSTIDLHEPLTLGFMQVGLDIVTSAICKS
jgi:hypothetical protein